MNRDPFEYLNLSLDRCTHLTGRRRTRLISFLLRWEQYETALACLDSIGGQLESVDFLITCCICMFLLKYSSLF